eukprot:1321504-Prymnesium_polylepis.1
MMRLLYVHGAYGCVMKCWSKLAVIYSCSSRVAVTVSDYGSRSAKHRSPTCHGFSPFAGFPPPLACVCPRT